jgi:hypothetical protein
MQNSLSVMWPDKSKNVKGPLYTPLRPKQEQRYSYTISLASALEWGG